MPYIGGLSPTALSALTTSLAPRIANHSSVLSKYAQIPDVEGSIPTRVGGISGEVTRAQLAADPAFTGRFAAVPSLAGSIPTNVGGANAEITRAQLAADAAFASRYARLPSTHGAIPTVSSGVADEITRDALAADPAFEGRYLLIPSNDGNIPTAVGGASSEITRNQLAADDAWATRYAKAPAVTGGIPTRASNGSQTEITRATLAADAAFVTRYFPLPSGTPTVGQVPVVSSASPLAVTWGAGGGGSGSGFGVTVSNVKEYGAKGDGSADDTAAIRAAIAALPFSSGGVLFFPPGNYRITDTLVIDYGVTVRGSGWATTGISMSSSTPKNMFVGGPSFPVYVTFENISLDGGSTNAKATVPTGDGTIRLTGAMTAGQSYRSLSYDSSTMGSLQAGDVIRIANEPPIICTLGTNSSTIWCAPWTPSTSRGANSTGWTVFRNGDIITNGLNRVTLNNVRIYGAKRHGLVLGGTEHNWSNVEIGGCAGSCLYAYGATEIALVNVWFWNNGGPHYYSYAGVNNRFANVYFEGSGSNCIFMEYSELQWTNGSAWGGREGQFRSEWIGPTQLTNVVSRGPGAGSNDSSFTNSGFPSLMGRTSFAVSGGFNISVFQATNVSLFDAPSSGANGCGPVIAVDGNIKAQLTDIFASDQVRFNPGVQIVSLSNAAPSTLRGVRDFPDSPFCTVRPLLGATSYNYGDTATIATAASFNYTGTVTRQWQSTTAADPSDPSATWVDIAGGTGTTVLVPAVGTTGLRLRYRNTITYNGLSQAYPGTTFYVDAYTGPSVVNDPA